MPPPGETLSYDDDGSLTSDWRWTYNWGRKSQLTSMTTSTAAVTAGARTL